MRASLQSGVMKAQSPAPRRYCSNSSPSDWGIFEDMALMGTTTGAMVFGARDNYFESVVGFYGSGYRFPETGPTVLYRVPL